MTYFEDLVKYSKLLVDEKKFETDQYLDSVKNKTIYERKSEGKCIFPLTSEDISYGLAGAIELSISVEKDTEYGQFNTGTMVSIFYSSDNIKSNHICNASIKEVKKEKVTLILSANEVPDELEGNRLGMDLTADDRTYKVMEHTMNHFINTESNEEKALLKKLWGEKELKEIKFSESSFSSNTLNEWQEQSVKSVLSVDDFLAIHGPPGTGKTTTLVQCIKESVKSLDKPVLVCATSNAAVDHLVKSMLAVSLKVVRIGNLARIDEQVQNAQIDIQIQADNEYKFVKDLKKRASDARKKAEKFKRSFDASDRENRKRWYKESRDLIKEAKQSERYLIQKTLESAEVIATTLIGSDSELLRSFHFPAAFIDEAAQALIPAALTPLKRSDKLVLAGDPFQLPPLVKNEKAAKQGLSVSLLELVMQKTKHRTIKLKTQYRMDDSIMEFSNSQFYENELISDSSVASHGFKEDGLEPVEFIDTAGCGFSEEKSKSGRSLSNPEEVKIILARIKELEPYLDKLSLGIISPYRGQVNLMKDTFENAGSNVNTIDAFQGQERDVIIVSLVRSNEDNTIGFLKDYRRMNVAMTRARKKLILIGDSATIGGDSFYGAFLDEVEKKGSYRTAWEYAAY